MAWLTWNSWSCWAKPCLAKVSSPSDLLPLLAWSCIVLADIMLCKRDYAKRSSYARCHFAPWLAPIMVRVAWVTYQACAVLLPATAVPSCCAWGISGWCAVLNASICPVCLLLSRRCCLHSFARHRVVAAWGAGPLYVSGCCQEEGCVQSGASGVLNSTRSRLRLSAAEWLLQGFGTQRQFKLGDQGATLS